MTALPQAKRNNKANSILAWGFMVFAIAFVLLLLYQWWHRNDAQFVRYNEYGISIPINYSIHGIDVSHHNGSIAWQAVRSMLAQGINVDFAIIKATEGVTLRDSEYARNWKLTRKVGITRGAYHYFNEYVSGKAQALHYIATVGNLLPGDLPPVLDIEEINNTPVPQLIANAKEWLQVIQDHYHVQPIVYTYAHFYNTYFAGELDDYPLWVAHYKQMNTPNIQRPWLLWQHSDAARVNGISTPVDFNVYQGDQFSFKRLLVH